ncbi:MAG: fused response regulator/phosphatase [Pseudomonadota bacterium]
MVEMTEPSRRAASPRLSSAPQALVVDDSPTQRRILCALLSRLGYRPVEISAAEDAPRFVERHAPRLILSDMVMPGLSGPDLCRAVRAGVRGRGTAVILLSADEGPATLGSALAAGADGFVAKPASPEALREALDTAMRNRPADEEMQDNALRDWDSGAAAPLEPVADPADLDRAARLQAGLGLSGLAEFGSLRVAAASSPLNRLGGDLVGVREASDGRITVFGLDVSGHGVAAALAAVRIAEWIGAPGSPDDPPATIIEQLNMRMMATMQTEIYATLALARIDPATGTGRLCSAGYHTGLIQRCDGSICTPGRPGQPIGLFDGGGWRDRHFSLDSGERLFLFSDGLMPDAEDRLLRSALEDARAVPLGDLPEHLLRHLAKATPGSMADDRSIIVLERQQI